MSDELDPDKTAAFDLGPHDSERRVLLLHGFTGSPWDVRPLAEVLAVHGYRVVGPRLPGHGTTPEAMLEVNADVWEQAVMDTAERLSADGPIHLAGLSMGALLSVIVAGKRPEWVRSLVLMAPAMKFIGPTMRLVKAARRWPLIEAVRPWEPKQSTDIQYAAVREEAPVMHRLPTARLRDLFFLQDRARALMSKVRAPALLIGSDYDHVVSIDGARELADAFTGEVRLVRLSRGFHIVPRDYGAPVAFRETVDFLEAH